MNADPLIGALTGSELDVPFRPAGEAKPLPGGAYVTSERFALERNRLFARGWIAAAAGVPGFAPNWQGLDHHLQKMVVERLHR